MSNFVCRWRTSPTWTNFIPVVKTHQTQADARERRLVGSSVTRQRQDAKSSCPATESGVSSTDIWPVRALHPIPRQRRRSCWPATWRSEERGVGQGGCSTCVSRGSRDHYKKKI